MNYLNLYHYFIIREDCFPYQNKKFGYSIKRDENKKDIPINENYIKKHLEGKITLGTYNLNKDNKVKWGCLDYDENDIEDFEKAKKAYLKLKELGLFPLIENSGGGIYKTHVWIFCDEIDAEIMKNFLEYFCNKYEVKPHEIFPKQTKLVNYGNLVKLPLGINKKTNNRSYIFNDNFEKLDFEEGKEYLWKLRLSKIPIIIKEEKKEKIKNKNYSYDNKDIEIGEKFVNYIENNNLPKDTDRNGVVLKNYVYFLKEKGFSDKEILNKGNKILDIWQDNKLKISHIKSWLQTSKEADRKFNVGEIINWIKRFNISIEIPKKNNKIFSSPNWIDLLRQVEDEIIFYFDKNNIWWIWEEKEYKWVICDETDIFVQFMKKYPATDLTNQKIKIELTNAMKLFGRMRNIKKPKPKWIQFNDKVFNIETKEIFPVSNKYFFTNPIKWSIGNSEETPTIDKLFIDWVGEQYKELLYEIIAYSLYRDYPIHRIFCFTGSGRNGKSKYLGLINKFIGNENSTTSDLDLLMTRPFESFKLYKKLICQMGETNYEGLKRTAILKELSGQDPIGFEKKGKDGFTDYNYAKLMLSTNGIPITHDKSDGFYRRWLIIDFPNNFPEGIDILKTIPDEEYNNLSKKCIKILPKLLEKGKFTNEPDIDEKKKIYEEKSNPLIKFLEERTEKNMANHIFKYDFKERFTVWLNKNGYRAFSPNEMNAMMKEQGFEDGKRYNGDSQIWAWIGISWCKQSKESKESNTFKSEANNRDELETSGFSGFFGLLKLIFSCVDKINEIDLLQKLREIQEFEYKQFDKAINKMIDENLIMENPKGTYVKI